MNNYPRAYINYLIEFHGNRDYFECHEIMEEYWKEDKQKKWLALIQLAVAIYHERQNNTDGSLRLYRKVLNHLRFEHEELKNIAIDSDLLVQLIKSRIINILEEGPYYPMNLPLTDEELIETCKRQCQVQNLVWCCVEDVNDKELILRHKLRDRTLVIQERLESLSKKEKERKG